MLIKTSCDLYIAKHDDDPLRSNTYITITRLDKEFEDIPRDFEDTPRDWCYLHLANSLNKTIKFILYIIAVLECVSVCLMFVFLLSFG